MKKYLNEMIKRKDLMLYLVTSGLKAQNRNNFLGYFWWLLDPLLGVFIYYFVVAIVFRGASGPNYGVFLVIGMIVWRWLSSTVSSSVNSIISQSGIITQVYLPKSIFPIGASLTQFINFGFGLIVIALFCLFFKVIPGLQLLWLPFIILMQLFFMLAIAFPVAYLCVFIRDINNIIDHLMRLWFFGSPVIWNEARIPAKGRWLLDINPMTHFLSSYRNVLMNNETPDYLTLFYIGTISLILIAAMLLFYNHYEYKIIKAL